MTPFINKIKKIKLKEVAEKIGKIQGVKTNPKKNPEKIILNDEARRIGTINLELKAN